MLREMQRIHALKQGEPLEVLDLGAGHAPYWFRGELRRFFVDTGSHLSLLDASSEFDIPNESNLQCKKITARLPEGASALEDDSYDYVIALDLLEHLTKSDGYLLLYEIDRISRYSSTIYSPNGFVWQPPATNNHFNAHVSAWTPREMKAMGWVNVYGQVGPRMLFGSYGLPRFPKVPWFVREAIALLKVFSYRFPSLAFSFIATKRQKNPRIHYQ